MNNFNKIFFKGSRTYFFSSLLFPPAIRADVAILYSFVRTADNFVDIKPQQNKEFQYFAAKTVLALNGKKANNQIIDSYADICKKYKFSPSWTLAFLNSMKTDLSKKTYKNFAELDEYIYGSAEVIGLMMAKIMSAPRAAYTSARMLGKAMQYLNIIRDIQEDYEILGRTYIPKTELLQYNIKSLNRNLLRHQLADFNRCIVAQINRFDSFLEVAKTGFHYLPYENRVAVTSATELYEWTANEIKKNPSIVFTKKLRPSLFYVMKTLIKTKYFL